MGDTKSDSHNGTICNVSNQDLKKLNFHKQLIMPVGQVRNIADANESRSTKRENVDLAEEHLESASQLPFFCGESSVSFSYPRALKYYKLEGQLQNSAQQFTTINKECVCTYSEKRNFFDEIDCTVKTETQHSVINKNIDTFIHNSMDSDDNNLKKKLKILRVNLIDIKKLPKVVIENKKKVYEVDRILGKKNENDLQYYLIKWKNWSMDYNTWEPINNLSNCFELIEEFENLRQTTLDKFQKHVNFYPTIQDLEQYMRQLFLNGKVIDESFADTEALFKEIGQYFKQVLSRNGKAEDQIKDGIIRLTLFNNRNEQLASLADWENEMNSIAKGKPHITVENFVDLEREPQDFFYVDDYLPGLGVVIPEDPPIGCDCFSCDSKTKCCFAQCDGSFPYSSACKIKVPPGTPIYECNKRCTCSANCQNRVVQRGSEMKLCVFRTKNGTGWGVKTLKVIKKGTFVIQYVGEVITSEEAEKRGKQYDAAGRTYLFDLDYNDTEGQCPYTVDAAVYGNISHFINHSCDPNLAVYAVWINCLDPNLPKLALFATKDIKQNEEITFDYMFQAAKDDSMRQKLILPESQPKKILVNKTKCRCGAKTCRQYLF